MHVLTISKEVWQDYGGSIDTQLSQWFCKWDKQVSYEAGLVKYEVAVEDCCFGVGIGFFDFKVGKPPYELQFRVLNPAGCVPPQPVKRKVLLLLNH